MTSNDPHEPVTVTDKRRVDPETGQVREQATGPAPSGPARAAPRRPLHRVAQTKSPN